VRLTTEERAVAVAAVLACGARAIEVIARVGDPAVATRCAALARELLALDQAARAAELARLAAELGAPAPAHLRLVHPSWIEASLKGEPEHVRAIVAGATTPAPAPVVTYLRRRAFAHLVDMPDAPPLGASSAQLERAIVALGRRRLALALRAAPQAAQAAVAARLGPAEGPALVAELAAAAAADRAGVAEAVRSMHDLVAGTAAHLLVRAGARVLAPALAAAGDLPRQLAQRLPLHLGRVLLDEVARASGGASDEPLAQLADELARLGHAERP
jgi:hypothetical protein